MIHEILINEGGEEALYCSWDEENDVLIIRDGFDVVGMNKEHGLRLLEFLANTAFPGWVPNE